MKTQNTRMPGAAALTVLGALALTPFVQAQTAPTTPASPQSTGAPQAPTTTAAPSIPEDIIMLSPFEVSAENDRGYLSENTLSGSRLNSSIKDTPAVITVFNNELIRDLGVNDLSELVRYDANVQMEAFEGQGATNSNTFNEVNASQRNTYRSRGLPGSQARDFYLWLSPQDNYNIERVDFSKGPNGVLFGVGALGGTLNAQTKRALLTKNTTELSYQFGSWGLNRAALDTNYVIARNKLAVRLNLLKHQENGYRYDTFRDKDRGTLSASYKPFKKTTIRFSAEQGKDKWSNQRPFGVYDSVSEWYMNGQLPATYWTAATNNAERGRAVNPTTPNTPPPASVQAIINQVSSTGFGVNNNTPYFVATNLNGSLGVYNAARSASTTTFNDNRNAADFRFNSAGRLLYDDPSKFGALAISDRVAPGGPDTWALNDYSSMQANLEQTITKDLQFELTYFRESVKSHGQNAGGLSLRADPNPVIGNANGATDRPFESGTITNPNAGRLFLETNWERYRDDRSQDAIRGTLAYDLNLPIKLKNKLGQILGRHRFAASAEHNTQDVARLKEKEVATYAFRTMGMTIAPGTAPGGSNTTHTLGFNRLVPNAAVNGANQISSRNYVTLGDWQNFNAGRFYTGNGRDLPLSQVAGATVPTTWVPSSKDAISDSQVAGDAMMAAVQSFFWKNKLVTTFGYRQDHMRINDTPSVLDGIGVGPDFSNVADYDGDGEQYEYVLLNDRREQTYVRAITRSAGLVFHATKWISLFANESSGTSLPILNQSIGPDGRICPGQTGKTTDYGIIFSLMDDKISGRIARYDTTEDNRFFFQLHGANTMATNVLNVLQNYTDASNNPAPLITAEERAAHTVTWNGHLGNGSSKGYEFQLRYNPTPAITLMANYSKTERTITNVAKDLEAWVIGESEFYQSKLTPIGQKIENKTDPKLLSTSRDPDESIQEEINRVIGNIYAFRSQREFGFGEAPNKAVVTGKYSFQAGALKGLGLGGSVQWMSGTQLRNLIRYNDTNGNFSIDGAVPTYDANGKLLSLGEFVIEDGKIISDGVVMGRENMTVDAFATYRLKSIFKSKVNVDLQLNIRNILDDKEVQPQSINGALTGFNQYTYKEPRSYRFTVRMQF